MTTVGRPSRLASLSYGKKAFGIEILHPLTRCPIAETMRTYLDLSIAQIQLIVKGSSDNRCSRLSTLTADYTKRTVKLELWMLYDRQQNAHNLVKLRIVICSRELSRVGALRVCL